MKLILALSFVFLSTSVMVISATAAKGQASGGIAEKAKSRSYAGGVDEDDLKVQEQLPSAIKKVSAPALQKKAYKDYLKKKSESSEDQSKEESQRNK